MTSNLPLGEQVHIALVAAAKSASEALRLEKLAKRVMAQLMILSDEKSVGMREATARADFKYTNAEDAWIQAETTANIHKAEADGLKIRWETWRTEQANTRAEMQLR